MNTHARMNIRLKTFYNLFIYLMKNKRKTDFITRDLRTLLHCHPYCMLDLQIQIYFTQSINHKNTNETSSIISRLMYIKMTHRC
jgi:hypothetical protein